MQTTNISWANDEDLRERFFEKVDKDQEGGKPDCWIWTASVGSHGYGAFGVTHADIELAHRVSYALEYGELPEEGVLCHHCDTPRCVNPDHLYAGTHTDNLRDAVDRGGYPTGDDHFNSVLTEGDVREMRERYASGGMTYSDLAEDYPVTASTIGDIIRGDRWSHVE